MLKALQLAVAVGVLVLFWMIYPGVMAVFASGIAFCYIGAALAAAWDRPLGVWLAFLFTLSAFGFSAWGVYRYLDNGFEYWSGNFPGWSGFYLPPYVFLAVALGAAAVIVLHALSWRWLLRPRRTAAAAG